MLAMSYHAYNPSHSATALLAAYHSSRVGFFLLKWLTATAEIIQSWPSGVFNPCLLPM